MKIVINPFGLLVGGMDETTKRILFGWLMVGNI